MPRVSQETLDKLKVFIDSLPDEARNKCALCNETLTHIVKRAEVETGAGTATVTRELANRINETSAPGDRVSDQALKQKVMRHEGVIGTNRTNNHQPATAQEPELFIATDDKEIIAKSKEIKKAIKEQSRAFKEAEKQEFKKIDETPFQENERNVQIGDVWQLGDHRLYCGDFYLFKEFIKADALITDPPYGIDYTPDWRKWDGSMSNFRKIQGDDRKFNPEMFLSYPTVVLFGAAYFSDLLPVGGWICWDKRLDEEKDLMVGSSFELAWFKSSATQRKSLMIRVLHGGVVNADSTIGNNEKRYHPTQKPVQVMAQIISSLTKKSDTILDPFIGSGSTILACEKIERTCIAFEIDPEYVKIAISRWESLTGNKAAIIS